MSGNRCRCTLDEVPAHSVIYDNTQNAISSQTPSLLNTFEIECLMLVVDAHSMTRLKMKENQLPLRDLLAYRQLTNV